MSGAGAPHARVSVSATKHPATPVNVLKRTLFQLTSKRVDTAGESRMVVAERFDDEQNQRTSWIN